MSLSTKVVFPAPPPTTNELTPQQRAQLIRQAKKIEQLLGSTPYLVDTSVVSTGEHRNHALWYAFPDAILQALSTYLCPIPCLLNVAS